MSMRHLHTWLPKWEKVVWLFVTQLHHTSLASPPVTGREFSQSTRNWSALSFFTGPTQKVTVYSIVLHSHMMTTLLWSTPPHILDTVWCSSSVSEPTVVTTGMPLLSLYHCLHCTLITAGIVISQPVPVHLSIIINKIGLKDPSRFVDPFFTVSIRSNDLHHCDSYYYPTHSLQISMGTVLRCIKTLETVNSVTNHISSSINLLFFGHQ